MNSTVAQVDSEMGISRALNLGITNIVVEDTRLSGHVQTSCMHVVIPDKLVLYLVPVSSSSDLVEGAKRIPSSVIWYVFPGQEYIIHVRVFSKGPDAKEIHIAEVREYLLSKAHFDLTFTFIKCTYHLQKVLRWIMCFYNSWNIV